jgi:putative ABC transport system permease protein
MNDPFRDWNRSVSGFVAWRLLTYEKMRNTLAILGIVVAILMIFLQLGFYEAVPRAGMLVYDHLRFDLMLTSSSYVFQAQPYDFPRRRLYQALSLPEVESASPFYQGEALWLNQSGGMRRDIFVMGFKLEDDSFKVPDIERQLSVLQRPDRVLVDTQSVAMYGPQTSGRIVEIGDRAVEIGGQYSLGTGFVGLGVVVTSDLNFIRIFPTRSLDTVTLGLLRLRPGREPDRVATQLRALLPADTRVFTRPELAAYETGFWRTRTATGVVFGFGVVVSIMVGMVILYQALATQITRHLPEYATLKAIGYTDGNLRWIVVTFATVTAAVSFVPASAAAILTYDKVRVLARMPIEMTAARLAAVLLLTVAMAIATALFAVRILRRVDPAELF